MLNANRPNGKVKKDTHHCIFTRPRLCTRSYTLCKNTDWPSETNMAIRHGYQHWNSYYGDSETKDAPDTKEKKREWKTRMQPKADVTYFIERGKVTFLSNPKSKKKKNKRAMVESREWHVEKLIVSYRIGQLCLFRTYVCPPSWASGASIPATGASSHTSVVCLK